MRTIGVILLFLPLGLLSQTPTHTPGGKNPDNLNSVIVDISPETLAPREIQFPFSKIEIIDSRFDTSKLGFVYNKRLAPSNYKDFSKIKVAGGVTKGLKEFYNDYYQLCFNNSGDQLLIVLKKLWIDNLPNHKLAGREYDINRRSFQEIHIKFEFYLHRDQDYYPLTRVDTVCQLTEENISSPGIDFKRNGMSFFYYTLKTVVEKLNFNRLLLNINTKRKLSIGEIDSFNVKRFSLPILTASKYNEGVFMNIREFINNNPSVKIYKINQKGILVFGEKDVTEHIYWAFADSKGLHTETSKKMDMFRVGNTFEFFIKDTIYFEKLVGGAVDNVYSPRQIDMETGIIY